MKLNNKKAGWAGAVLASGGILFAGMPVLPADAASPDTYPVKGVDTSHFNHDGGRPIDWRKVRSSGQSFMYAKATEGADWSDEWFQRDLRGAQRAGLPWLGRPGVPGPPGSPGRRRVLGARRVGRGCRGGFS